jgi:hypothetical protein
MATQRKVYHSSNTKEGWKVTHEGKALSGHSSQEEAEAEAIRLGKKAQEDSGLGQAVLHKADGEIREERTYGKDPERSPG